MAENGDTMEKLAEALSIHYNTLSIKLSGKREFTQSEIKVITNRYCLCPDEVIKIFF